jgi:outer membrane protein OmpA-like peptidoglycan-associated protein
MFSSVFRYNLLLALFIFSFGGPVLAQKKDIKAADLLYQKFEYARAVEAYKKALEAGQPTLAVSSKIADCYRLMNNAKETEFWYAQVLSFPDHEPQHIKYYANAARKNGNFSKAQQLYLTYGQKVPAEAEIAQALAAACANAQQWVAQPLAYALNKVKALNSENADFSPTTYLDGLVFTSNRAPAVKTKAEVSGWTGKPDFKLFYVKGNDSAWQTPELMPEPLNNKFQNGSAVFSPNQEVVYFTRINQVKQKSKKANTDPFSWVKFPAESEFINRLEIFISEKKEDKWSEPKAFPYNKVSDYSVGHPALAPDGNTLYFASDMPGGVGETDIYYSQKQADGNWSKPQNLGPAINTAGKELFPTFGPDSTFYFSSEGHSGIGGLDIYATRGAAETWKNVRNLKYPLNSSQDDFGILFDKTNEAGYLSSNREAADGADDIYAFKFVRTPCNLAGKAIEKIQVRPGVFRESPVENVMLRLYKENDTTSVVTYSDAKGFFTFPILDGVTYTVKGIKTGYLTRSVTVAPKCESTLDMVKMGMVLNRNTLNKPIIIENIYYDLDKYVIRPDAALELDKLVRTLKDNPTIKIELSSHTDSRNTNSYNNLLSQLRAEAAVKYMITKGIAPNRMVAKGYGESRLLNKCADNVKCSEENHQLNRRTEFKILQVK